jgi:uncharacterized secreted protein with C-terminal beta-propeller domain
MAFSGRVAVAAVSAVLLGSTLVSQAPAASGGERLVAFRSCGDLLSYVRTHAAPFVTAYGLGQRVGVAAVPSSAPGAPSTAGATPQQGVDYSGTNVQEAGVDEPDIVKTNGVTLFAAENGRLEAVDVHGGRPKLLDTLELDRGWSHELLLSGTHLLVLSRGGFWVQPLPARPASMIVPPTPATSTLTEVDVSDPASLKVVRRLELDGAYVDARMVGSMVRVVASTGLPIALPTVTPTDTSSAAVTAAKVRNETIVASSGLKGWLPTYKLGRQSPRPLVSCRRIRRPVRFSGLGMLTVTTIDLAKGLAPVDSTAVMTDGRIVYASPERLYVATEPWSIRPLPVAPNVVPETGRTQIHAFDISGAKTGYLGSGSVSGFLLSQWSLSEFEGVLRVVSTDTPAWLGSGPASETYLTTLRPQSGGLVQVGQLAGLGRGERVYAVRMIGDTGYLVTFRQVDPLFTIDLRDPARPQVLGRLQLPGYSSYLHPISSDLLLGIGQEVDPQANEPGGTQVSLFDVSDPRHPTRLQRVTLGQGWSAAESDHHAFLYWPATGLVVVPFGQQAVALHVSSSAGMSELGRIVHGRAQQAQLPQLDRSVVVGSTVLTVSSAGVASNGLASLTSLGWAPFPAPPPAPKPSPLPGAPSPP